MKWPLVMILVGLSITGCQSQPPVCDPFFGRTTIPPPPTGSIGGRAADPCYPPSLAPQPVQTPMNPCPPQVQLPAQSQSNPCLPLMPPAVQTPSNPCPPQVQLPSQPAGQSLVNPPPTAAQPLAAPSLAPPAMTTQPTSPPRLAPVTRRPVTRRRDRCRRLLPAPAVRRLLRRKFHDPAGCEPCGSIGCESCDSAECESCGSAGHHSGAPAGREPLHAAGWEL